MIKAYVNYPNPHITIHCNSLCSSIQSQQKPDQRYVKINLETISSELNNFANRYFKFAADSSHNDLWLEIDFEDQKFETEILGYVCRLLGKQYSPFGNIVPQTHC